jgi:hypothetical protein
MTVDHFRPVSRYGHLRLAWTNLYYACSVCNSHYKRERPTSAEEAAGERFVNPCSMDPDNHFRLGRDSSGGRLVVTSSTRPGRYTIRVLGFNERRHLRDWWMELDREEVEVERHLACIRDCIQQARAERRRSEAARVREMLNRLRQLEADSLSRLRQIHSQWPFPVRR